MKARRIDRTLLAVVGEGFFSRLSFGFISFAFPLYARELGMEISTIGLVMSVNMMVAIVLKPFLGSAADRFGRKPILVISILFRSVVSLMLSVATLPWHLFASRGLHGVSIAMRDPAVNALIAENGGKKAIASSFAWYQTSKSVAGTLGKTAAGLLIGVTNYAIVFHVSYVLSLIPVVLVIFLVRGGRSGVAARAPEPKPAAAQASETPAAKPPVVRFSLLGFLISGTAYMLANLFPLIATEFAGLTEAQAGLIASLSALPALMGPVFGWLSDHVSQKLVLSLRSIGNVFSSVLYLVAPGFAGMAAGRMMDDLGKAAFRPAWGAVMARVSDFNPRSRARTMGAISAAEDAGEMVGPIVASLLWTFWGVPVLLAVRVAAAIGTEVYTVALTGSLKRLNKRTTGPVAAVAPVATLPPAEHAPTVEDAQTVELPAVEAITQPIPAVAAIEEAPAAATMAPAGTTAAGGALTWSVEWRSEGGLLRLSS